MIAHVLVRHFVDGISGDARGDNGGCGIHRICGNRASYADTFNRLWRFDVARRHDFWAVVKEIFWAFNLGWDAESWTDMTRCESAQGGS